MVGLYIQHINIHSAETIREFKNSLALSDATVVMNCYCPCPAHHSSEMLLKLKCMSVCTSRRHAMTETETPAVAAVAAPRPGDLMCGFGRSLCALKYEFMQPDMYTLNGLAIIRTIFYYHEN